MTYRAKYEFRPRDNEELELRKNETVSLVSAEDNDWWQVRNQSGGVGLVPRDYLEEVMYSDPAPQQAPRWDSVRSVAKFAYTASRDDELSLRKGDCVEILEKEGDGWWRGKVGGREGWFPANYVEEISGASEPSPPPSDRAVVHRVVAMYSFNSGNSEELQFRKGDVMEIIDQPADDPDWWEARHQGETNSGLIPRNYVEIIEESSNAEGYRGNSNRNEDSSRYPFCNEVWYHGKISRGRAEHVLRPTNNGQFLVRASETKVSVHYLENQCILSTCILNVDGLFSTYTYTIQCFSVLH